MQADMLLPNDVLQRKGMMQELIKGGLPVFDMPDVLSGTEFRLPFTIAAGNEVDSAVHDGWFVRKYPCAPCSQSFPSPAPHLHTRFAFVPWVVVAAEVSLRHSRALDASAANFELAVPVETNLLAFGKHTTSGLCCVFENSASCLAVPCFVCAAVGCRLLLYA